jgi:hypothetical protein
MLLAEQLREYASPYFLSPNIRLPFVLSGGGADQVGFLCQVLNAIGQLQLVTTNAALVSSKAGMLSQFTQGNFVLVLVPAGIHAVLNERKGDLLNARVYTYSFGQSVGIRICGLLSA